MNRKSILIEDIFHSLANSIYSCSLFSSNRIDLVVAFHENAILFFFCRKMPFDSRCKMFEVNWKKVSVISFQNPIVSFSMKLHKWSFHIIHAIKLLNHCFTNGKLSCVKIPITHVPFSIFLFFSLVSETYFNLF